MFIGLFSLIVPFILHLIWEKYGALDPTEPPDLKYECGGNTSRANLFIPAILLDVAYIRAPDVVQQSSSR